MYSVGEAKQAIKDGVRGYLYKNEDGTYAVPQVNRLPFYLEGVPGIGKTEMVKQIAKELGISFVSFSLTHHTRNSILGLPVIQEFEWAQGKYTEYTMSEIVAKVYEVGKGEDSQGILLLDELNSVSETIFPLLLEFLQTKRIGNHSLPEGWILVTCGNPTKYNRSARQLDAVILDRVRRMEVESEPSDFLDYADEQNMNPLVISYLKTHPEAVYKCDANEIVTCRGWENLSRVLEVYEKLGMEIDHKLIMQMLKSEKTAFDFYTHYVTIKSGFTKKVMDEILAGRNIEKNREQLCSFNSLQLNTVFKYLADEIESGSKLNREKKAMQVENVFMLLEECEQQDKMDEAFFFELNKHKEIVSVLGEIRVSRYLKVCERLLGVSA